MVSNRLLILSILASLTFLFLVSAAAISFAGELQFWGREARMLKTRMCSKADTAPVLRLIVQHSGITAVSSRDLHKANMRINPLSAEELSLTRNGQPVPFHVHSHGYQAALYFYAQVDSAYGQTPAVYVLTTGRGIAMNQKKAAPPLAENDDETAMRLDWTALADAAEVTLVNGQAWFHSQASLIQINNVMGDLLVFDVTDPQNPAFLRDVALHGSQAQFAGTGTSYVAFQPYYVNRPVVEVAPLWKDLLRQTGRGADYIAIVSDVADFTPALKPLLDHRQKQGLRVTAVPLSQIFDEFGHGQQDSEAVTRFLNYAQQNWQPPAPRFVLFVGEGNEPFLGDAGSTNLLPTALMPVSPLQRTDKSNWFSLMNAELPQMAIGYLPVQTTSQLVGLVQKTLAYETATTDSTAVNNAIRFVTGESGNLDVISEEATVVQGTDEDVVAVVVTTGHRWLFRSVAMTDTILASMAQGQVATLGEAILELQKSIPTGTSYAGTNQYPIRLLGDPALALPTPAESPGIFLQVVSENSSE